jgi:hypothetical protein
MLGHRDLSEKLSSRAGLSALGHRTARAGCSRTAGPKRVAAGPFHFLNAFLI